MRRLTILPFIALLLLLGPAQSAPGFSLGRGDAAFWRGPHVKEASGKSWTYRLRVTERAYRLRIGIDHPEVGDVYDVTVSAPGGGRYSFSPNAGLYSAETAIDDPARGVYRITVTASDVTDSAFRMRAKLEAREPSLGTKKGSVLPNLQVLPAHEASFRFPVSNGSTDGEPIGADTMGAESCHPEEHAEDRAVRCLRFAFGIRNTGRGPLQLHLGGGIAYHEQTLIQRVQRANETFFDREAGIARYHKTHAHYHHHAAVGLQLFKVTNAKTGSLDAAGQRRTKGFAHREELLRDWNRFYPTWAQFGFGLGPGWADIYEWDRPGNYIDFGLNGDGRYVIRMWADPVRGILESNERDNAGYTYLKVAGSSVKVLEVGRGRHPWDPCKIVMGKGGYPDPPPRHRPAGCPPDTT